MRCAVFWDAPRAVARLQPSCCCLSRRELPCVHLGKRAVCYRLADILALIEARSGAAIG